LPRNGVVVFERLIGLLSLSELLGTKRTHWRVKKQPFKSYLEANLAVMSQMQQDSSTLGIIVCMWVFSLRFSVLYVWTCLH